MSPPLQRKISGRLFLWPLVVLTLAYLFWSRDQSANQRDAAAAPPSAPATPPSSQRLAGSGSNVTPPHPPREYVLEATPPSREETLAAVHAKVAQWLHTKTGDTEAQEALTNELVALLTDANTADIIHALSPDEFNTPFGAKALERWLKIDANAAAHWIADRPDATEEHALIVARQLKEDPAALNVYSASLSAGTWKENVLNYAALETVPQDPAAAVTLAQQMAPGDARMNAFETIAYDWFGRDLAAATAWAKNVEDPILRERLYAVGAKAIAVNDPDLAAGWLVTAVKTDGVLNETALGVVETWADQHPAEAANWVARFSEAGPRKTAIDLLLRHWLQSDPAAANAWIQTLPERDSVLEKLKADQAERDRPPEKE